MSVSISKGNTGGFARMTFCVLHAGNKRKSRKVHSIGIQSTARLACSIANAHGYDTITVFGIDYPASMDEIQTALMDKCGTYGRKG